MMNLSGLESEVCILISKDLGVRVTGLKDKFVSDLIDVIY